MLMQNGRKKEEVVATLNIKGFPDELYEQLRERARRERRSLSQEVIQILSREIESEVPLSLLLLKGLGRDRWKGIDAARHVADERAEWD
jgi:plasmid stability protein